MNNNEAKSLIRKFLKQEGKIDSDLGSIEVKEEIGQGGNAIVYNAVLGTHEVALKILAEERQTTKYQRFITEFREIVQLSDTKAVVPIYYFGHMNTSEHEFAYMVMKKYPHTLRSWNAINPISDFNSLRVTMNNLLNIVSVIHDNHIVHRDIKPENILVTESGDMVLADFGISWFDPELYERSYETGRGDRMANFDYSAPEQFIKGSQPHPTMDIFALAQVITWLITGGVARGDRKSLMLFDSSFDVIEPVIKEMLNRHPEQRPQSIDEILNLIKTNIKERDERTNFHSDIDNVIGDLRKFDDVLLRCFPGERGLIETDDTNKINAIMTEIYALTNQTHLEWTQGSSTSSINRLAMTNEDTWLIDMIEIQVEKIWALKNQSLDHQFLLIKTKPMPSFGIYGTHSAHWEEAAIYKGNYISSAEFDDGYTVIDGQSVKLNGEAQYRMRFLRTEYYFIGTSSHPITLVENETIVDALYEKLLIEDSLSEEDIHAITKLKRHKISIMMS